MFLLAGAARAQAQTHDLPDPGMLPDKACLFPEKHVRGDRHLLGKAAGRSERSRGKPEAAEMAIDRYEEQLERSLLRAEVARAKGQDTDEVLARTSEATLRHQAVLADDG